MIDTDKYTGHSTEYSYEIVSVDDDKDMDATYALLNDAPLFLAEVKRLREGLYKLYADINSILLTKDALMRVKNVFDTSIPTTLINIKDLYEGKEMIE